MAKKEKIGYKPIDNAYTKDIDAWFIVVMIVFIFPVGVWLMWSRTSWKKWIKILVTVLIGLLFIVRIVTTQPTTTASDGSETTASVAEVTEESPSLSIWKDSKRTHLSIIRA